MTTPVTHIPGWRVVWGQTRWLPGGGFKTTRVFLAQLNYDTEGHGRPTPALRWTENIAEAQVFLREAFAEHFRGTAECWLNHEQPHPVHEALVPWLEPCTLVAIVDGTLPSEVLEALGKLPPEHPIYQVLRDLALDGGR